MGGKNSDESTTKNAGRAESFAAWALTATPGRGTSASGTVRIACPANAQTEVPASAIQRVQVGCGEGGFAQLQHSNVITLAGRSEGPPGGRSLYVLYLPRAEYLEIIRAKFPSECTHRGFPGKGLRVGFAPFLVLAIGKSNQVLFAGFRPSASGAQYEEEALEALHSTTWMLEDFEPALLMLADNKMSLESLQPWTLHQVKR